MRNVTYVNNHLCQCGYGVLLDCIPLGTIYTLDVNSRCFLEYLCGGCGAHIPNVESAFGYRAGTPKGFLPLALFKEFQE